MPVKTFLNCTMPELVNMSVGSLRGTNGLEGTSVWPFASKYLRKLDRMSLTLVIKCPSAAKAGSSPASGSQGKRLLSRGLRVCPARRGTGGKRIDERGAGMPAPL